jgi:C-terminal processing protease CtpA/Prc
MSGMHLEWTTGAIKVRNVDEGTPAAAAGVKAGDVVLQLNELKAGKCEIEDLRDELCSGDGNQVRLRFRRDGEIRDVEFRLKRSL